VGKRDRKRRPARRAPFRDVKPRILVVTEGEVTEPEYLDGFRKAVRNPRVDIEYQKGAGVPKTIVEVAKAKKQAAEDRAKSERDDNLSYDEVWCVFDRDDHPNYEHAKQMAKDSDLELAISNPCIELWLYLHFAEQPGMQPREKIRKMLKRHLPRYDKHVDYAQDFADGYENAHKRAKRLDENAKADGEEHRNPTTGVWRLTESIAKGA
jgi:hypothetical protein